MKLIEFNYIKWVWQVSDQPSCELKDILPIATVYYSQQTTCPPLVYWNGKSINMYVITFVYTIFETVDNNRIKKVTL